MSAHDDSPDRGGHQHGLQQHGQGHPRTSAEWDARYAEKPRIWSGEPNAALVVEVAGLSPGRVLDVGCGEGADAIWLARNGWRVTALDVSSVALDRAREAAAVEGVEVDWVDSGLLEAHVPEGGFDLVSAFYAPLHRTADHVAERALADAVAPGGTLLVVHHADFHPRQAAEHGSGAVDVLTPEDVSAALDASWRVEVLERRPRPISGGEGAHHKDDVVLRARRVGACEDRP